MRAAEPPSVAPIPARRLDALQFDKIKLAHRLQPLCERGLLETVGQVVEPRLILTLEVEQGAYRILPALRSGPAVLRPAVLHPGLRCLAALSIAPLSFRVTYRHCSTSRYAPLRNRFGLSVHRCRFAPSSLTAPPAGSPVAPVSGGDDASLARPTFPHQAVSGRGARCCGSNCVRSRSIAHATASNRSATVRSARPWRCPRAQRRIPLPTHRIVLDRHPRPVIHRVAQPLVAGTAHAHLAAQPGRLRIRE